MTTKTLEKVKEAMESDQGVAFRRSFYTFIAQLADDETPRRYKHSARVGATALANACDRKIWLDYRWGISEHHSMKALLIFQRGFIEEARILAGLEAAGMTVLARQPDGRPFRFNAIGDAYGGMIDGLVTGCPDLPDPSDTAILEMKTANDKAFGKIKTLGVKEGKPEHYQQIQQYLLHLPQYKHGLYVVVNKNTEEWYIEVVDFDPLVANFDKERMERILLSNDMPAKTINPKNCTWCPYQNYCFGIRPLNRSCRTCGFSRVYEDRGWVCVNPDNLENQQLSRGEQENGCILYTPVNRND